MFNVFKRLAPFNTSKTLIFVSEYDHFAHESTGLSTYSRLTLDELQDKYSADFRKTVILSVGQTQAEKMRIVQKGRRLIIPCINKRNPFSLFKTLFYCCLLTKPQEVIIEFEFASYGGPLSIGMFVIMLTMMKLMQKRVHFVIHQAVNDLKGLHEHLGLSKTSIKLHLLDMALNIFYSVVGVLSYRIVVLEEEIKNRISSHIEGDKILVIPHSVQKSRTTHTSTDINKDRMDILIFGYIAWYKGLDRFIKAFNKVEDKNVYLTIAGGYSPAQRGKAHYERHYKSVLECAKQNPRITITGYVPETKVGSYYRKTDLCILPYRTFISSSGPLSQAFSFYKSVVLSSELQPYMKSKDFNEEMQKQSVSKGDLFLPVTHKALDTLFFKVRNDKGYLEKLKTFSKNMAFHRSWKLLIPEYRNMILSGRVPKGLSLSAGNKEQPRSVRKGYSYA